MFIVVQIENITDKKNLISMIIQRDPQRLVFEMDYLLGYFHLEGYRLGYCSQVVF